MSASAKFGASSNIETRIGVAPLAHEAMYGRDLSPVVKELLIAANNGPARGAALMDLATIEQLRGNLEQGLQYQSLALQQCQIYETYNEIEPELDLLVLAAPIHMGGNTPVEFLLAGTAIRQRTLYLGPELEVPDQLPEHDVVFVAAPGDCSESRHFLGFISDHLDISNRPLLNHPAAIFGLERDTLTRSIATIPGVCAPDILRVSRQQLQQLDNRAWEAMDIAMPGSPFLIRPVGSHAGRDLKKMSSWHEIAPYLERCMDDEFFISSFVDYRSSDGLYRKYRITFVDGEPFACHMAISEQWDIWYLNADMQFSRKKRMEEQHFMEHFDDDFRLRHERALCELGERVGLEYFGIDCAENRDGELVIFEADNALIVHDMDPPDLFPYKSPQMKKIFSAFVELIGTRADSSDLQWRRTSDSHFARP